MTFGWYLRTSTEKILKFVTTLTRRVWQNVKYRVAELTEIYSKIFLIISAINAIGLSNKRVGLRNIDDIYRCNCNPQISYLLSEKVFFVLGFVLEGINNENFMVSCFSSIYKTVWTSVTMVTKQNLCFIRHSPSSCPAVLISVTHQVKAFAF